MALSIFLAKFFGIWFILAGIAWLYKKESVQKLWDDIEKNPSISALAATINLIVGLLVVLLHNNWMWGWPVIITLIGWIALLKAVLRMFRPSLGAHVSKALIEGQRAYATGFIVLLVGVLLTYIGFTC